MPESQPLSSTWIGSIDRRDFAIFLPAQPPIGELVKEREPRWRRVARHTAGLFSDPVVQIDARAPSISGTVTERRRRRQRERRVAARHERRRRAESFRAVGQPLVRGLQQGIRFDTRRRLLYGPAAANTLWSGFGGPCETRNDGDPIVRYDHLADRWVMSQLAIPNNFFGILLFGPFYECIAVSATSDPLGAYYRYQYSFDKLNDYPKIGVWPDGYYMTMNQYTALSLQFAGQGVVAFDRAKMLQGQPASAIYYDLSSVDMNLAGMLPADLDGPAPPAGSPAYFAQIDDDAWGPRRADQCRSGSSTPTGRRRRSPLLLAWRRCRRHRSIRTCAATRETACRSRARPRRSMRCRIA